MTRMPLSRYTPIGGKTRNLKISPSDGQPSTAPRFPSTQAMRSHHVSSTSDLLDVHGCHWSDWCTPLIRLVHLSDRSGPPVRPVWCCRQPAESPDLAFGSTKEPLVVLWCTTGGTPQMMARPPHQASSHKSFASAARTSYSILPCSLTWLLRSSRLADGFEAETTKPHSTSSCFSCTPM